MTTPSSTYTGPPAPAGSRYFPQGEPTHAATLIKLLAEKGITKYALFHVTGEDHEMPNGEEESSGSLILPDGRIFSFWISWDAEVAAPYFSDWDQCEPHDMVQSNEFRLAMACLGLL